MNALGRHILVEFIGCTPEILNDVSVIETAMVNAAQKAGATVIQSTFHHFSPFGVSGVVVIQESHLAIHTWPEYQYAAVDLFTCGESVDSWISFDLLKEAFQAKNQSVLEMHRGPLPMLKRIDFKAKERKQWEQKLEQPKFQRNLWFTDKDENQALSLRHTGNILFNETSPFQQVRVMESYSHGKFLAINNMVMCTERDEFHYHEMITHPALQAYGGEAKRVLIIGGGDGGTAREVLRYPSIEKLTMVEIDEAVVRASKEHLPQLSRAFSHPKLDLKIADGIQFVKEAKAETYDLVIVDGSDPVGPAEGLFTEAFFRDCHRILKKGGLLVGQSESPLFHEKAFVELNQCLKGIFGKSQVHTLLFFAPTYPTGMWSLQLATKSALDPKAVKPEAIRAFAKEHRLRYYNEAMHQAAFALPGFVKEMLKEQDA
jgi:spermidine synthase